MKIRFAGFLLLLFFCYSFFSKAQEKKQVAITFNGLPTQSFDALNKYAQLNYFDKILTTLDKNELKITGFAIGKNVEKFDIALLSKWIARGHSVGNLTYNYLDFNHTSAQRFIQDIELAKQKLEPYIYDKNYFRFPKLHEGNEFEKKDSVWNFLNKNKFQIISASIDLDDEKWNKQFIEAKLNKNENLADSLARSFVKQSVEICNYYDKVGFKALNRPIKHILVLDCNFLNAFYLQDFLDKMKANDWEFISLEEALTDPIYKPNFNNISAESYTVLDRFIPSKKPNNHIDKIPITNQKTLDNTFENQIKQVLNSEKITKIVKNYNLMDFYNYQPELEHEVDKIFNKLSDQQKVGQLLLQAVGIYGKTESELEELVRNEKLGGVILLNGNKADFTQLTKNFNNLTKGQGSLPLLFTADAEPSLINKKIIGTKVVSKTSSIKSNTQCITVCNTISKDLKEIGIHQNYAPVCDLSNQNAAMFGSRSFGGEPKNVVNLTQTFIENSQKQGIIATAKHFPGHGFVQGDSHKQLVYIDGEMRELAVYKPLIEAGVLSIMVGHIAIQNNPKYQTNGMPASCSRKIVTDLLKNELNFRGLIVTDAMNMGALKNIPNPCFEAVKAGCDMILMPADEEQLIQDILDEMQKNPVFKNQIYVSVKKIIRLKICLGLFQ